jgi:hypothetical protein
MASNSRARLIIPILIVVVGFGWLLTGLGYGPGINWVWTLGLGVIGILVFLVSKGIDKVSVVVGVFLLLASVLSVLRQTGQLTIDIEVPILVISIGILLLVAQLPAIPKPAWYVAPPLPVEEPSSPKKLRLEDIPRMPLSGQAER